MEALRSDGVALGTVVIVLADTTGVEDGREELEGAEPTGANVDCKGADAGIEGDREGAADAEEVIVGAAVNSEGEDEGIEVGTAVNSAGEDE